MNKEYDKNDELEKIEEELINEEIIEEISEENKSKTDKSKIFHEENEGIYPKELYAGFFKRFFAFILDSMIGGALARILLDLVLVITNIKLGENAYGIIKTILVLGYFTGTTYFTGGQTLGKLIFGLKVVSLDGKDLTIQQILTREFFGRYIHTYGLAGFLYLMTAFTEKKQNLSDLFADTSVLDLSKEEAYKLGQDDKLEYVY